MKKYFFIIILILSIIFVSGCVQQSVAGRGIDFSLKSDRDSVFADQSTTLYVDIENKDNRPYWKVFVDVFDPGMFGTERINPQNGVIGEPRVLQPRPCKSSFECYDEDYGGCGVCYQGFCVKSERSQSTGMSCDKTCQCVPNSNLGCIGKEGAKTCQQPLDSNGKQLKCLGGTPANKCAEGKNQFDSTGTQAYFCDEFGYSWSLCQGMDGIIAKGITGKENSPEAKDDCGCPADKKCRGDGTCGSFAQCFATIYNLQPNQITTLECKLKAPLASDVPKPSVSNDVNVRLRFTNKLTAMQTIEMISEDEYNLRQHGGIQIKPKSYTYKDSVVQLDVEFSKELPIVVREGEKIYMYLTAKNIGDGMIYAIRPTDFFIIEDETKYGRPVVGKCDNREPPIILQPQEKTFPKITCELNLPPAINYLSNYVAIINIDYSYEYRKTISIGIMR